MIQAFHPSLPGTLVAVGWDGSTRPRRSHWGANDTSSLRKARVNGPCSGPNAHVHELIFKSISLIARKSVARQIDFEFRIATHPAFCIHPLPPSPEQSRGSATRGKKKLRHPAVALQLLTRGGPVPRPQATGVLLFWGISAHAKMCSWTVTQEISLVNWNTL